MAAFFNPALTIKKKLSTQKLSHSLLSVPDDKEVGVGRLVLVDGRPVHVVLERLNTLSRRHGAQER